MNSVVRLTIATMVTIASSACPDNPTDAAHHEPIVPVALSPCRGTCAAGDWTIRWDRTSSGWSPPIFDGRMTLERNGSDWGGRIQFQQTEARPAFDKVVIDDNYVDLTFHTDREQLEISAAIHGDQIAGRMRDEPSIDWSPFTGTRAPAAVR